MTAQFTSMTTLNDLIKAAASGLTDSTALALEAERQRTGATTQKTASAPADTNELYQDSVTTDYAMKLAGACEYLAELSREKVAAGVGPGTGPNALQVSAAPAGENKAEAGHQGQATAEHIPPKNPAMQTPSETPAGPATALADNKGSKVATVTIEDLRKAAGLKDVAVHAAGAARGAAKDVAGAVKGLSKDVAAKAVSAGKRTGEVVSGSKFRGMVRDAHDSGVISSKELSDLGREGAKHVAAVSGGIIAARHGLAHATRKKEASAPDPALVDYFLSMTKAAEDAINPAHISAGAAVAPDTDIDGSKLVPSPAGPDSLVASNEAAINYTKGQAKSQVRGQLGAVLTEPALSAAHDQTLNQSFSNTGSAGVKIASHMKAAAIRALVTQMASATAQ